jgi:nitrogen fixation protein FixH
MGKQRPDGWWYPWIFVGGFMVVLGVNVALLYFATTTFNGLETRHAFEEGNDYNARIAEEEKQKALGWTVTFAANGGAVPGSQSLPARLTLNAVDAAGNALEGLEVYALVRRPTQEGHDQSVALDPVSPGKYARTVDLPLPGQWDIRLMLRRGEDVYRLRKRINIQ